jgi:glycosyltransferase involved in cell wall biosynthesis
MENKEIPDVSFVVIAFNEQENIAHCITSILRQTTKLTMELIFVDDGSTDNTIQEALNASKGDPRFIKIENKVNLGRGKTRAAGLAQAKGKRIAFIDSDIILPNDWLAICVKELGENVAISGLAVPDGDIAPISRIANARPKPTSGSMPITGNNVLFDGDTIRKQGFPKTGLGEDFRLAANLLAANKPIKQLNDLFVLHQESKTYSKFLKWMFVSGVDATSLLIEFRFVRKADLAWAGWFTTLGPIVLGLVTGNPEVFLGGIAINILFILLIALAHCLSRFALSPFTNWTKALLLTIPAMACYLGGRTVGLFRAVK